MICRWETFRVPSLQGTMWGVEFILFPICDIVFNVIRNTIHFVIVANNMVVETSLPCEIDVFFVGVTGDGLFELTKDNG